jgi:hypothetical protein
MRSACLREKANNRICMTTLNIAQVLPLIA